MRFQTTLAGSYPKLPSQTGEVNLRVVLNRRDQGKASDQDVANAVRETTRRRTWRAGSRECASRG